MSEDKDLKALKDLSIIRAIINKIKKRKSKKKKA